MISRKRCKAIARDWVIEQAYAGVEPSAGLAGPAIH